MSIGNPGRQCWADIERETVRNSGVGKLGGWGERGRRSDREMDQQLQETLGKSRHDGAADA